MWIRLFLLSLVCFCGTEAADYCEDIIRECKELGGPWTRCYEDRVTTCRHRSRIIFDFNRTEVNSSLEAEVRVNHHMVRIPSSALRMSRGALPQENVKVVASLIHSKEFKVGIQRIKGRMGPNPFIRNGTVMEDSVLSLRAGNYAVRNLSQRIKLIFKYDKMEPDGTCVFWEESQLEDGTGQWSIEGCDTNYTGTEYICSCDHLSFFAVLVNPVLSVDEKDAVALSYITYTGSALSILFSLITIFIYMCLQRRRPEKAVSMHIQLSAALFCLHLSFVASCIWTWMLSADEVDWFCQGLGLFLHWSLLATFSWMALEGFHLYLLLVRVFNIYVRRYLLKLCLFGWGLPTVTVALCGGFGIYGKYKVNVTGSNNQNSTSSICWFSSEHPQWELVSFITTVGFPGLVMLWNSCMLFLVVFKLWGLRSAHGGFDRNSAWKTVNRQRGQLWKDAATVLGLSCVLGLTWILATTTYISVTGIYVFTILNSVQGVFIFIWSLALTCKARSDHNSSTRDGSSQKVMTTSFNN
ncbi:uncharacterized protein V6R79_026402 [Siganus canaliculatus]